MLYVFEDNEAVIEMIVTPAIADRSEELLFFIFFIFHFSSFFHFSFFHFSFIYLFFPSFFHFSSFFLFFHIFIFSYFFNFSIYSFFFIFFHFFIFHFFHFFIFFNFSIFPFFHFSSFFHFFHFFTFFVFSFIFHFFSFSFFFVFFHVFPLRFLPGPRQASPKTSLFTANLGERRRKKERKEERKKKERADRNRHPSTIARTGLFCCSRAVKTLTPVIKGRSPTMRHVSRTHRVALDWLFDRIDLDPEIEIKYVDTEHQLADTLTKGNFTRDEWNTLLHLFNISHFSSLCCAEISA